MDILEFRDFCMNLPLTEEAMPFGEDTLVFKIGGKMYALTDINQFQWVNLKCDPAQAIELREKYSDIVPGWHMNKKHWNTVKTDGDLPEEFIFEQIRASYMLVVDSLPVAQRNDIKALIAAHSEF